MYVTPGAGIVASAGKAADPRPGAAVPHDGVPAGSHQSVALLVHLRESGIRMREHLHVASARRDDRLARIRKLTLWISGGAAAASLGLGTAFAHALPGHSASSQTTSSGAAAGTGSPGGAGSPSGSPAGGSASGAKHARHHHHKLAKPQQQPVQTPAPPVVSSGGS
jgi:hypothetical protein